MPYSEASTHADSIDPSYFDDLRSLVDFRLGELFPDKRSPPRLICAIRHGLLSPGKRFRPIISLLACRQWGADEQDALDVACAVEMVHAASLMMDDLPSMDDAQLRRGCVPTHVVFGEGTGMLATITLLNEAYGLIANMESLAPNRRLKCAKYLSEAVGPDGLAGGQENDIACDGNGVTKTLADMELRHRQKTGALFAAAAAMGAEAARADADFVEAMWDYGLALGLGYQAFDDVVDCSAASEETGKDMGQDEGKSTVVSLLGRDGASSVASVWLGRARRIADGAGGRGPRRLSALAHLVEQKFTALTA
ncbi:MAG: polyprenyl synthetase family protein [Pseudomonadota bacterium]